MSVLTWKPVLLRFITVRHSTDLNQETIQYSQLSFSEYCSAGADSGSPDDNACTSARPRSMSVEFCDGLNRDT